jgi:hypothetical protein
MFTKKLKTLGILLTCASPLLFACGVGGEEDTDTGEGQLNARADAGDGGRGDAQIDAGPETPSDGLYVDHFTTAESTTKKKMVIANASAEAITFAISVELTAHVHDDPYQEHQEPVSGDETAGIAKRDGQDYVFEGDGCSLRFRFHPHQLFPLIEVTPDEGSRCPPSPRSLDGRYVLQQ